MTKALLLLLGVVVGVLLGLVAESLLERVEPLPNVEPDWGGWGW